MTIAGLARAAGVGVETVRYYQRRGLLRQPPRSAGGAIRRYDGGDLRRLRFVRAAQVAGFTLEEIGELLTLDAGCDRARARALATRRLAALEAKIAELERARASLHALARACAATATGPCPIIAAFEPDDRSPSSRPRVPAPRGSERVRTTAVSAAPRSR